MIHLFHDWTKWERVTQRVYSKGKVVAKVSYQYKRCKQCRFEKVRPLR